MGDKTRGVPPTTAKQEPDGGGTESHYQTLWGGGNLQTSPPVTLPNGAGGLWERFQQPPLFFACPLFATQSRNGQTPPVRFVYVLDI